MLSKPPIFKPFHLALVQLGSIGFNKADNLRHARDMVLKAARGNGSEKPNIIVLPVRYSPPPSGIFLPSLSGSIQFTLWPCTFPAVCRDNRIRPRTELQCPDKSERKREDALLCGKRDGCLAHRRFRLSLILTIIADKRPGSIPEQEHRQVYNTCTVYSPQGIAIFDSNTFQH
jgi:omega-amidase